ncbi:unnamed protein product [Adineta steineri]|uniref:G-protein coupled receptors family 1 profile domain-containing protein n=1 Tax=Adineta steineri TaxID=433720 RepID=A0A814Q6V3_9BILA|nr:unnamed protein product [Adineta steineri]CAF1087820.1 unnamed protein product [Adineta steineri]CAF1115202.1 unnamed protein product [Adineta steineri]
MASSFIASLDLAKKEIVIYCVIPMFIMSIIGGCLNLITFLSLKTFRQSSCAFYLTIKSAYDVSITIGNILPYIMRWGFGMDWGLPSLFFCKIRNSMSTVFSSGSMTCLCLAVIDQYFATSSRVHWQKWCNIKLAHRLTAIFTIIWILQGIPYVVFYNHIISSSTNTTGCEITNERFSEYLIYGYYFIISNLLPFISIIFGFMAYHNARHLSRRAVPFIRRELDKQLTVMVLVQVLINSCAVLPFGITYMVKKITGIQSDPVFQAKTSFATSITNIFSILSYSVRILSIIVHSMTY